MASLLRLGFVEERRLGFGRASQFVRNIELQRAFNITNRPTVVVCLERPRSAAETFITRLLALISGGS